MGVFVCQKFQQKPQKVPEATLRPQLNVFCKKSIIKAAIRVWRKTEVCFSQTSKTISDLKNYFTYTKCITKNSFSDNFESKNNLRFSRLRNTLG